MMAENRFNVLTLWSLHPFTYVIRPKNFPEASAFSDAELAEWRRLWSGMFAMAKARGIETYLINWNVFVSPEFSRAHDVAPWSMSLTHIGKEADATGNLVVGYTREVVTQVLDEYPDLTGLGITFGERMGGMTPDQRRDWLDQTFVAGIAGAKRPAKFIYRAPLSAGHRLRRDNQRRERPPLAGPGRASDQQHRRAGLCRVQAQLVARAVLAGPVHGSRRRAVRCLLEPAAHAAQGRLDDAQ